MENFSRISNIFIIKLVNSKLKTQVNTLRKMNFDKKKLSII